MTAAIAISAPAARLLTRTGRGGRGCRSSPSGASPKRAAVGFGVPDKVSAFSFTVDLHFACFLAAAQNQFRAFEEPIHNVHVVLDPVVHHLLLAIRSDDNKHWRFSIPGGLADLDISLLAIVQNPNRTDVVIAAL